MTTITNAPRDVSYGTAPISAFQVTERDDKGKVTGMTVEGRLVSPTTRFWTSLCANYSTYGLSTKLFKLFQHAEVFTRLTDVLGTGSDRIRYAVEGRDKGDILLAVSNPSKPLIQYEQIPQILRERIAVGTDGIEVEPEYGKGVVRSTHQPPRMDDFTIGPDKFAYRYVMETPIDGYGQPLIYLSLLRYVCSNGAVGYARAFRTEIQLGRADADANPLFTLDRALDSFSNEEGYAALRTRFEAATNSWASIYETQRVYKKLMQMAARGMFKSGKGKMVPDLAHARQMKLGGDGAQLAFPTDAAKLEVAQSPTNIMINRAYTELVGDMVSVYGLTQIDALGQKKQMQLPTQASMYDLLSFVTELATHYCSEADGRMLHAEVGQFVSNEYDLENSKETHPSFRDFFTKLVVNDPETRN